MRSDGYETQADIEREAEIARLFAGEKGYDCEKVLKKFSNVDYVMLQRGSKRVIGVVEVKCRAGDWSWLKMDRYGGALIDHDKFCTLALHMMTGLQAWFVVGDCNGDIRWLDMSKIWYPGSPNLSEAKFRPGFFFGGRVDRNDPQDKGIMMTIPVSAFVNGGFRNIHC
jgi:hypothetical protein